jgi:hypothetical protein
LAEQIKGETREKVASAGDRLDFDPSEAVAVGEAIEAVEGKAAKERQSAGGKSAGRGRKRIGSAKLAEPIKGETREKVASAVGGARAETF